MVVYETDPLGYSGHSVVLLIVDIRRSGWHGGYDGILLLGKDVIVDSRVVRE